MLNEQRLLCSCYYTLFNGEWDRVLVTQVLFFAAQGKIEVQLSQALNKTQRETLGTEEPNTQKKERAVPISANSMSTQGLQTKLSDLASVTRKGFGRAKSNTPSQKPFLQLDFKRRSSMRGYRHEDNSWRLQFFILWVWIKEDN